jgi:hypothetical protein
MGAQQDAVKAGFVSVGLYRLACIWRFVSGHRFSGAESGALLKRLQAQRRWVELISTP